MDSYIPPNYYGDAFNCPHCGVYTDHSWECLINPLLLSHCNYCKEYAIWHNGQMIYPDRGNAPMPNPDLPEDIKADYEEAASIANKSPRGAAALLRLVIQKLCIHLGEKGENLNTDIGNLVKNGLPDRVQKALDTVRVIGNNAVHPGTMDLKDDIQTVESLFKLINIIAEYMITQPKQVNGLFDKLTNNQKGAIAERDNKN